MWENIFVGEIYKNAIDLANSYIKLGNYCLITFQRQSLVFPNCTPGNNMWNAFYPTHSSILNVINI